MKYKVDPIPKEKPILREQAPQHCDAISIETRFADERERLAGNFTEADRQWRKQWVRDQRLAPDEPRYVPELEKEFLNPIRRFYRKPFDMVYRALTPVIGPRWAFGIRYAVPKFMMFIFLGMAARYYGKYNMNDWTSADGWHMMTSSRPIYPGDPDYPKVRDRIEPSDYDDRGFKARNALLNR